MDIATTVGLVGGLTIILSAMSLGGGLMLFVNVPSILIVFGGSTFIVMMKFNLKQTIGIAKVTMGAFFNKSQAVDEFIERSLEMAQIARKDGPLALESFEIPSPFLKRGIQMVVDGTDPDVVKEIMQREKKETSQRHTDGQAFFKALTDVAPAMGMIGTLVGLVQMLANMSDPKSIGPAMAVALLTTLYGAMIANMFSSPVTDKLSVRASEEDQLQSMMIDVVYSIGKGLSKAVVQETLCSYLPVGDRKIEDKEAA